MGRIGTLATWTCQAFNYIFRSNQVRARSRYTSVKGLRVLYNSASELRDDIEANLADRMKRSTLGFNDVERHLPPHMLYAAFEASNGEAMEWMMRLAVFGGRAKDELAIQYILERDELRARVNHTLWSDILILPESVPSHVLRKTTHIQDRVAAVDAPPVEQGPVAYAVLVPTALLPVGPGNGDLPS